MERFELAISEWLADPLGAMQLTEGEVAFIERWSLSISTAYIGMIRCYWKRPDGGTNVVFQTGLMEALTGVIEPDRFKLSNAEFWLERTKREKENQADLRQRFKTWLGGLMSVPEELLQPMLYSTHTPLFEGKSAEEVVEKARRIKEQQ